MKTENAALTSGLEWNTKVTRRDLPETIDKIAATFEYYWNNREFEYYFSHKFYIFTITQVRLHFKHKIILYYSTYLPLKDGSAECRGVQQLCGASAMGLGAVTKTINRTAQIKLLGVTERSPLTFQIFLASASALERRKGLTRWMRIDIILRKETFR